MKKVERQFTFSGTKLCESRFYITHPSVTLIYFAGLLTLLFLYQNPIFTLTTLLVVILLSFLYAKPSELSSSLKLGVTICLFVTILNPLINHRGMTTLFNFFDIKITLESLLYGLLSGLTLTGLILLFVPFNTLIDSERFLYLFSKFSPKIAFITGMTLRFIPTFSKRAQEIKEFSEVRESDTGTLTLKARLKKAQTHLETLFNACLEDGMGISTVLKTKAYAKGKRTSYRTYQFKASDCALLILLVALLVFLIIGSANGAGDYSLFPRFIVPHLEGDTLLFYLGLAVYLLIPFILEGVTQLKRRVLQ